VIASRPLSGDFTDSIHTALSTAGRKDALVLGANVAQQCLDADLVDEILLFVLPIVLGDTIRLFRRSHRREMTFDPSARLAPGRP
jgi:dihydrofolate reductase